ncbi:MAG TPA: hypothetical protein VH590_20090 [Ktedonobacterales bacterium]|jgi:WD40 repeat protein
MYRGHTGLVWDVAWSPDGSRLASGSGDTTVQVWDATTGETLLIYGHRDTVYSLAWSPDGTRVASCVEGDPIQVWDAVSGEREPVTRRFAGNFPPVFALDWSPDGQYILTGDDKWLNLWAGPRWQKALEFGYERKDSFWSVGWSPDGKYLAYGLATELIYAEIVATATLSSVQWEIEFIATFSPFPVQIKTIMIYRGHHRNVRAVAWSPDGRSLASGGDDGVVRIWEPESSRVRAQHPRDAEGAVC